MNKIYFEIMGILTITICLVFFQISPFLFLKEECIPKYFEGEELKCDIRTHIEDRRILVDGWMFDPNDKIETWDIKIYLLAGNYQAYLLKANMNLRPDVEKFYKKDYGEDGRLKYSGFTAAAYTMFIPKGKYKLVVIYGNNKKRLLYMGEEVTI